MTDKSSALFELVQSVFRLAAAVLPLWPRMRRSIFVGRAPIPRPVSFLHDWVRCGPEGNGGWHRCSVCWQTTRFRGGAPAARNSCPGAPVVFEAIHPSHAMVICPLTSNGPTQNQSMVLCIRCGRWAIRRPRELRNPCKPPSRVGRKYLRSFARGILPGTNLKVHVPSALIQPLQVLDRP